MSLKITALLNQKLLHLSANNDSLNDICLCSRVLESKNIYEISITKDFVIITTEYLTKGSNYAADNAIPNNIDAYDWHGNHVWNIADVIGNKNVPFWGGTVATKNTMKNHFGFNEELYDDSCELFCCSSGNYLYVINLDNRKLVQVIETR